MCVYVYAYIFMYTKLYSYTTNLYYKSILHILRICTRIYYKSIPYIISIAEALIRRVDFFLRRGTLLQRAVPCSFAWWATYTAPRV